MGAAAAAGAVAAATDAGDVRESLAALAADASQCERCELAAGRGSVVFGAGRPDADIMLVGDAPGFHDDRQGTPFVGAAGELVDRLLASVELSRDDVYLANVLKCRPPGNREPRAAEIESCESWLFRQIALVQPVVVAALGTVALRMLSTTAHALADVHGVPGELEVAGRTAVLYPLYHPAAALYTPAILRALEEDFARLPSLVATAGSRGEEAGEGAVVIPFPRRPGSPGVAQAEGAAEQLPLF